MKGIQGVVLGGAIFAMAMAAHAQDTKHGSWEEAVKAERQFCMSDVCLGMTFKEIAAIPGTQLRGFSSNTWKRNCEGDFRNWEMVDFIAKDGTHYSVGFRDFPGGSIAGDRFRVQSVALYHAVEWGEFLMLATKLPSRYNMKFSPGRGPDSHDQEYKVAGSGFAAVLSAMYSLKPKPSLVVLSAKSDNYPLWLKSQPACAVSAKPLPNI